MSFLRLVFNFEIYTCYASLILINMKYFDSLFIFYRTIYGRELVTLYFTIKYCLSSNVTFSNSKINFDKMSPL